MTYWYERLMEIRDSVEGVSRSTTKAMIENLMKDIRDEEGITELKK